MASCTLWPVDNNGEALLDQLLADPEPMSDGEIARFMTRCEQAFAIVGQHNKGGAAVVGNRYRAYFDRPDAAIAAAALLDDLLADPIAVKDGARWFVIGSIRDGAGA